MKITRKIKGYEVKTLVVTAAENGVFGLEPSTLFVTARNEVIAIAKYRKAHKDDTFKITSVEPKTLVCEMDGDTFMENATKHFE